MDEREQDSGQPELQEGEFRRTGPGAAAFQVQPGWLTADGEQPIKRPSPLEPEGGQSSDNQAQLTVPPARSKPKGRTVFICVALVVVLAAGGAWWVTRGPAPINIKGTLTLGVLAYEDTSNPTAQADGDTCQGFEGYGDIISGIAVTVGGSTGQTLGIGQLSTGVLSDVDDSLGTPMGDCVFTFDVAVPNGQSVYTVTISHRGTQTFTPTQVASGIALTLGN